MTATTQAIAWTLIHFCWQAAAIAAAYRGMSFLAAKRSSNTRYLLALSALLLMLVASVATFAFEMQTNTAAGAEPGSSLDHAYRVTLAPFGAPSSPSPSLSPSSGEPVLLLPSVPALPLTVLRTLVGVWMLGVLVLALRSLGGWWLIQRLRVTATDEAPAAARASLRRIANALGIRRPVLLRVTSAITGPVTVGALRALVLLPVSAATSLSPEQLEVVLAHELAHIRRADFFWNLVQTLVETLYFFHPAVWWIGGRIRHERELCCDDLALTVCPDPVVYASALYQLERQRAPLTQFAMAIDGHQPGHTLRMRIARILGENGAASPDRGPISLAAAAAVLVILLVPVPSLLASLKPAAGKAAPAAYVQTVPAQAAASGAIASPTSSPEPQEVPAPPVPVPSAPVPDPTPSAVNPQPEQTAAAEDHEKGDYIDRMKAAGYDVDLDKYIAMKVQDITPDYARQMSQLGFGKLTADELIACKVQGVTPGFIANLKQNGMDVRSVEDAISYRIFEVTPEFVTQMKAAGF